MVYSAVRVCFELGILILFPYRSDQIVVGTVFEKVMGSDACGPYYHVILVKFGSFRGTKLSGVC